MTTSWEVTKPFAVSAATLASVAHSSLVSGPPPSPSPGAIQKTRWMHARKTRRRSSLLHKERVYTCLVNPRLLGVVAYIGKNLTFSATMTTSSFTCVSFRGRTQDDTTHRPSRVSDSGPPSLI